MHLIESIKGKGVAMNMSTDSGEALHPQTRKHWQRSNHQADTVEDQMLRMEYEKEVILNIRHCIEMYNQQQLFDDNITDKDCTPLETAFKHSHVHLGSCQHGLKLLSYEKVLEETIGFHGFSDSLARFLCDYALVEVYGSDFVGDRFEGHQYCIYWLKVIFTLLNVVHQVLTYWK
ncbi:hypothetical protein BDM02DRAFT_3193135 [Thelephora ganbajun]|uniref:Uncharacterized protein n=1 Tax=Thelephora ganbajun TaxID=370292 RepID=A0ACB6YYH2_THEGA|nr:hypothetical protein BDM02DRAFT_3193135 [Thelephora ganbajun]